MDGDRDSGLGGDYNQFAGAVFGVSLRFLFRDFTPHLFLLGKPIVPIPGGLKTERTMPLLAITQPGLKLKSDYFFCFCIKIFITEAT